MTPYELAYEYVMHTNRCIFLTGKAGTGKTTFLRRLRTECPKQMCVVAPTGVAAINAEGVTIHSLFQLPPRMFQPTDEARRLLFHEMQMREQKRRVLKNLELLIIDEVSMVRADLMDTMDAVLRHFKHRNDLPFGGAQVLFIGDLYQLSPVTRNEEWDMMRQWYEGPYFFQARVFQDVTPVYIELNKVFRQTNQDFISLLNQVRENRLTHEGLRQLNSRYQSEVHLSQRKEILLSTHNHKVDEINAHEMDVLKGKSYTYRAEIEGTFPESLYPMDEELQLKVGARVMFIKNDSSPAKAYYNGLLGTVQSLAKEEIVVICDNGQELTCHTETWENIRYNAKKDSDLVTSEVIGKFKHYPLRLAWAVTIHKAQGLTFDHVLIDAADAFASGQVYVALSRCRSLEGITLTSPIPERALTNAVEVVNFTNSQPSSQVVEQQLPSSEKGYLRDLLCSLYDFREAIQHIERLQKALREAGTFSTAAGEALFAPMTALLDCQHTAETFQRQIQHILYADPIDEPFLQQRLQAAFNYFGEKLQRVIHQLQEAPAYSTDEDDASAYLNERDTLINDLTRQSYIMTGIHRQPSVQGYYDLRQSFRPATRSRNQSANKVSSMKAEPSTAKGKASAMATLLSFLKRKDLQAVAKERQLSLRTIVRHLRPFLERGIIHVKDFSDSDKRIMASFKR